MESLELLEKLNKTMIDARKRKSICSNYVAEQEKLKIDIEHDLINNYENMSAKEKRQYTDKTFEILKTRHKHKYEFRELEILADLYSTPNIEKAINETLNKLRKLNQEIQTPIYHYRSETKIREQEEKQ